MKENRNEKAILVNNKGEFGVKQIAITVAVIVLIGFGVTALQGLMPGWIDQIWDIFIERIDNLIN